MKEQITNIATLVLGLASGLALAFIFTPITLFVTFIAVIGLWFFVGRKRRWRPLLAFAVGLAIAIPVWSLLFPFVA